VVADEYGIKGELGLKPVVDRFHHGARLDPLRNVGLVGDHQEEKSGCF
jgi:hypothetical protein